MVNAMNREGCIDTGSNPVLTTTLQGFNNSLTQRRYQLVEFSYI